MAKTATTTVCNVYCSSEYFFPYVVEVCAVQGRFWADSTCTMHYISHWIIHSIMFEHSCRIC